jgi:two-component system, sensor histidine kinase and response regulator
MTEKQKVLVVDDERFNVNVLVDLLKDDYKMIVAKNGEQALKAASSQLPDLILLDIMMPDMDGFEVCRRLKQNEELKNIPVLFISALDYSMDKVKGFELGALDYITKPFQPEEVKARVKTHLKLYLLQRHLEEVVAERTSQLAEAHQQLKDIVHLKNEFLHIISHEMRTPANGMLGLAEMIFDMCPDSEQKQKIKNAYQQSGDRMLKLLDHTLVLCDLEDDATVTIESPLNALSDRCSFYGINLKFENDFSELRLKGSRQVLRNLLDELVMIAKGIVGENIEAEIKITEDNFYHLSLSLNQLQESDKTLDNLFALSADVHNASHIEALGLAPFVALKIVKVLGGQLTASRTSETTGVIKVALPIVGIKQ